MPGKTVFNKTDTPEQTARKLNDMYDTFRSQSSSGSSTVIIAGSSSSSGGGSTTSNIRIGNATVAVGTQFIPFTGASLTLPYTVFIFLYDSTGALTPIGNLSVTTATNGFTLTSDVAGTLFYMAGSNA